MTPWAIWGAALALYLLFRLWYDWRTGPLTPAEIEAFLARVDGQDAGGNDPAALRAFLEADDGREFVMLNLVKVEPGEVPDPDGGGMVAGSTLMRRYSDPFTRALIRRGGHPGMVGRKVGPYVDAWQAGADPGWTLFGLMRYRSRRDLIRVVSDPVFKQIHPYKALALPVTFSFPTQKMVSLYASPRLTVGLVLALAAALGHLALVTL